MKLVPWNPRRRRTLWLDVDTRAGVDDDGRPVRVSSQGTRRPSVRQVLDLAAACHVERVMLTGGRPPADWLLARTPGWTPGAHHLDHETPVGRYVHDVAQVTVEVRRAVEWYGAGDYTPAQAREAWVALGDVLARAVPGASLLGSPGATGRECWLRSLPHGQEPPPQVSSEVAELLRATSGQHRIERFAPPPGVTQAADVWLMDGRLMYAACVRELGAAPVTMLTAEQAGALLTSPGGRYARARYQVRATVPDWWTDAPGILPLAADDVEDGWTYPREPGRTFTTWCDGAELMLALDAGWLLSPLAGMAFTPARPLDTWAARLLRAHDAAAGLDAPLAGMVRAGVRWMILHSIGAWHSSGRTETTVTASPMRRPPGDGWGAPEVTRDHGAVWRRRAPLTARGALMAHPEWSAQVWGRARARVLDAPTAAGRHQVRAGALNVSTDHTISIYGDAVMTSVRPAWAAPELDDGKVGRLRVKGHLHGPVPWPTTGPQRDQLMHDAERNGARCPDCQEG